MSDRDEKDDLLRVAGEISDGLPVDWEKESAARGPMRGRFARLRLLETLAAAHRDAGLRPDLAATAASSIPDTGSDGSNAPHATGAASSLEFTQWGSLRILERLARGGFGEVYRAYDPALQREVALKLPRPSIASSTRRRHGESRFLEEARRLARVRHPNVLVVHGADEHDGKVGLWTDLLDGRTLEQTLSEHGPLSATEAARIGLDLCGALAAVHAAGLVHRDVKTSNVMREKGGRIVLMDFSSVSEARPDAESGFTDVSGTPLMMAPEVILGRESPRPVADIYALGVLLYRMTSGRYPIMANTLSDLRAAHARQGAVPLRDVRPDLPTPFVQVVEKAMAHEPARRYASVGAMERDLAATLTPSGNAAQDTGRGPGRPALWLSIAAAGIAIAAVGIALLRQVPLGAFTVDAILVRQGQGIEERLRTGGRVFPGDALSLEFKGSESLYVYILDEDRKGETWVLFPAGMDLDNPLAPGVTHYLPGNLDSKAQSWKVTSAGGEETILIIASRRPLADLEAEIKRMPHAAPGRPVTYAQLGPEAIDLLLRGIGGMIGRVEPAAAAGSRLEHIAKLVPEAARSTGDIWVKQILLLNPGS